MLKGRRRSAGGRAWSAPGGGDAHGTASHPWGLHHCGSFKVMISALEKIIQHTKRLPRQGPFEAAPTLFARLLGIFPPSRAGSQA